MEEIVCVFEEIRTLLFYKRNFKGKVKKKSCTVLACESIFCFYGEYFLLCFLDICTQCSLFLSCRKG